MTDDEEKALRQALLGLDVHLRRAQAFWETPRNIALLVGAAATFAGVAGGFIGFKIGQTPPPPPIVIQIPK
jgi:hypothetical protein